MSQKVSQNSAPQEIINEKDLERKSSALDGFKKTKSVRDSRFGEINIYQNSTIHQTVFTKEKMLSTKEEVKKELSHLAQRFEMNQPSLLRLIDYSCTLQKSLCSKTFLVIAIYEVPDTDLNKEPRQFNEDELLQIYTAAHEGMKAYHSLGMTHNEISPLMIGRRSDTKEYMLMDRLRDPVVDPLKIQQNLVIGKQRIYMSPEMYEKLKGKQRNINVDYKSNDHFCLGMTILSLVTGKSLQECYLLSGEFDQTKLQEILTLAKKSLKNQELAYQIDCHLTKNSEMRMNYLDKQGIEYCCQSKQNQNQYEVIVEQDNNENNYFEIDNRRNQTPGKTTVTYYQDGKQIDPPQQQQDTVQYYYSQYNPNYQPYQQSKASYVVNSKTQYEQSTTDQTQNTNGVVQSTIIRRSYANINNNEAEYTTEWTTDEQGRKVEIRRYKPGYRPNGIDGMQTQTPVQPQIIRRSYVQSSYQPVVVPQEITNNQKVTYYSSYEEYLQAKQKEKEQLVYQQEQQGYQNQDAYNYYQEENL